MSEIILHAVIHGKVQGVFFRATTEEYAKSLGLKGTVRNVPDGTVEIFAQGPKRSVDKLIEKLKDDPGSGEISKIESHYLDSDEEYGDFHVIR